MLVFPAIDIKDKTCVRLTKGDFSTATQVADSPYETAQSFARANAAWVHMVDLDGAKNASPQNSEIFLGIAKQTQLKVQLGGGIRTMATVEYYLSGGIERVILGSAALKDPGLVKESVKRYGSRIAVGIDALEGMAAAEGWLDGSRVHYLELAKRMEAVGVRCIIFTDISRDGTLTGPNLDQLGALSQAVSCDIIASGGIRDIEDIRALKEMGIYGTICGKSLYQRTLRLEDAIALCGSQNL